MTTTQTLLFAFTGGLFPALVWLWFWLREDKTHPEPKKRILWTFVAGAIVIGPVLIFQKIAYEFVVSELLLLFVWAFVEEIGKFLAAYFAAFKRKTFDEPVDAMIYLISAALGFSALENILFLFSSVVDGGIHLGIITGNIRFVGASLLHILASASIGAGLAFSWYKKKVIREIDFALGLAAAVILHTLFNFFILNMKGAGIMVVFLFVWISVILLLAVFEAVKRIKKPRNFPTKV